LTRILHEFFEREGTRITRDADKAVARYVDVFVREAIARAAVERNGGFLEVSCSFRCVRVLGLGAGCELLTGSRWRISRRSRRSC
jgi:hypothetical protein